MHVFLICRETELGRGVGGGGGGGRGGEKGGENKAKYSLPERYCYVIKFVF